MVIMGGDELKDEEDVYALAKARNIV